MSVKEKNNDNKIEKPVKVDEANEKKKECISADETSNEKKVSDESLDLSSRTLNNDIAHKNDEKASKLKTKTNNDSEIEEKAGKKNKESKDKKEL